MHCSLFKILSCRSFNIPLKILHLCSVDTVFPLLVDILSSQIPFTIQWYPFFWVLRFCQKGPFLEIVQPLFPSTNSWCPQDPQVSFVHFKVPNTLTQVFSEISPSFPWSSFSKMTCHAWFWCPCADILHAPSRSHLPMIPFPKSLVLHLPDARPMMSYLSSHDAFFQDHFSNTTLMSISRYSLGLPTILFFFPNQSSDNLLPPNCLLTIHLSSQSSQNLFSHQSSHDPTSLFTSLFSIPSPVFPWSIFPPPVFSQASFFPHQSSHNPHLSPPVSQWCLVFPT